MAGPGFKMLTESDAARVFPNAKAGVIGDNGCALVVLADYLPGVDPTEAATLVIDNFQNIDRSTITRSDTQLAGRKALLVRANASSLAGNLRFEFFIVERDGWHFEVVRWTGPASPGCGAFDGIFSFLDGPIRSRPAIGFKPVDVHRLYAVRDGEYVDPWRRLRVKAPPGTTLMAGRPATARGPFVALSVAGQGIEAIVSAEVDNGGAVDVALRAQAEDLGHALPDEPVFVGKLGGLDVPYYELERKPTRVFLGATPIDDRFCSFKIFFAPALRAEARALVEQLLERTTVLSTADAAAEIAALPPVDPERVVDVDRTIRAERFIDFAKGIRAPLPRDPAIPLLAQTAGLPDDTRLTLVHWTGNSISVVLARPAAGDVATEQAKIGSELIASTLAASDLGHPKSPAAGAPRGVAHFAMRSGGDGTIVIDTFARDREWIHVVTFGASAGARLVEPSMDAFVASIALEVAPIES